MPLLAMFQQTFHSRSDHHSRRFTDKHKRLTDVPLQEVPKAELNGKKGTFDEDIVPMYNMCMYNVDIPSSMYNMYMCI